MTFTLLPADSEQIWRAAQAHFESLHAQGRSTSQLAGAVVTPPTDLFTNPIQVISQVYDACLLAGMRKETLKSLNYAKTKETPRVLRKIWLYFSTSLSEVMQAKYADHFGQR